MADQLSVQCARCGYSFGARAAWSLYWCSNEELWVCAPCSSGVEVCPRCGAQTSSKHSQLILGAALFLVVASSFTVAFSATEALRSVRGGPLYSALPIVVPLALAVVLAVILWRTLREVQHRDGLHNAHVRPLLRSIVPMVQPPVHPEQIEWMPSLWIPGVRSLPWKGGIAAVVGAVCAVGLVEARLPDNSVGSLMLVLGAFFGIVVAISVWITYVQQGRYSPRRFGLAESGIYVEYPVTVSARRFRYFSWQDIEGVFRGRGTGTMSGFSIRTRFGITMLLGVPPQFVEQVIQTGRQEPPVASMPMA